MLSKPYLSIPEVCALLQICKATFYKHIVNKGKIKLVKIGRRSFVDPEDLPKLKNDK